MKPLALILLVLALGAAGCGTDSPSTNPEGPGAEDVVGSPQGDGISVEEASIVELFGPILVNGVLIEQGGELKLCQSVMESDPPQCGEPSLTVVGNKLPDLPRGEPVSVRGEVSAGEITPTNQNQG